MTSAQKREARLLAALLLMRDDVTEKETDYATRRLHDR